MGRARQRGKSPKTPKLPKIGKMVLLSVVLSNGCEEARVVIPTYVANACCDPMDLSRMIF